MTYLPDMEWRKAPGLQAILDALTVNEAAPFAVGGVVRDSLLGLEVRDVDLATPLEPATVMERIEQASLKAIPTGIDHGTITAVADGQNFEITTYRRDIATDGRRATVAFSDDWREDAERRDFTINALYADIRGGEIFDSVGGLEDLEARRIRFIGDAAQRIAEDHLRILRYFRFFARFAGSKPDADALAACGAAANSLKSLSRERIGSEFTLLLEADDPSLAIRLMVEKGIFAAFMPEITPDAAARIDRLISREKQFGWYRPFWSRYLSLLPPEREVIWTVGKRLRIWNRGLKMIMGCLPEGELTPNNIREFAFRRGIDRAQVAARVFADNSELADILSQLEGWDPPRFSFRGSDLIELGYAPGPDVGRMLEKIQQRWIDEDFPGDERLREIAAQLVREARSAST